ncbi:MAG TPA: pyridoxal 5'-phosphate synthase glutaminase subunit PdxT [Phototrophicaceae bacterium]|jgi:5'-phosphate synthase pdxT subunit|nr:pyridoxal 5'-phosphate synthase glutaminase subunit PdxT [Phototrophicaceae bacterium]
MKVGVLALQGAFIEHEKMLQSLGAETVQVRLPEHLEGLDGLIIPGGESTTIGKLAVQYNLIDPLREFARTKPTWGTCAGMIFLAKDIGIDRQPILGLMNIVVNRNAFGRQIDSFEADLTIKGVEGEPFHAVFIRAPVVTAAGQGVDVLSRLDEHQIVAAQEGHWLATAFHPELTRDSRLHEYFLKLIKGGS